VQQVLFTIPIFKSRFGGEGLPLYGFGAMLFVTFVLVTWWGSVRAKRVGLKPEKFQDMTIWLFLFGLIGARLLYMIQYAHTFPNDAWGLFLSFFQIWRGGIIFYGSALGGAFGYGLFYWFVLRRLANKVNGWQLADAVAPLLALGLAIGRIGCFLNGCCSGEVANEQTCPVPLGAAHFPLLPFDHDYRGKLVSAKALQTSTGFTTVYTDRTGMDDPRVRVGVVEHDSPAARAGVKPGDLIVKVDGKPNRIVLEVPTDPDKGKQIVETLRAAGATIEDGTEERSPRAYFDDYATYTDGRTRLLRDGLKDIVASDSLREKVNDWPRGKGYVSVSVQRGEEVIDLPPFSPRSVGLYPTQLYETLSMVLLILLLLAYYPFRRHDGQLMVVCMIGYAVHRFINESLRVEPTVGQVLTLSQWGSVVILAAAVCIEIYLWRTMPSRWGPNPPPEPTPYAGA
jgi:phosphatidylglycerol:prolipoprotein diacylglycerol transferase